MRGDRLKRDVVRSVAAGEVGMRGAKWGVILALLAAAGLEAQAPATAQTPGAAQAPAIQPEVSLRPSYLLGPNDQIMIRVADAEEFDDTPFRIDDGGELTLPLVGKVRASGLTVAQLEGELTTQLRTFVRNPQVQITVVQFRSDPVFLVGAFQRPGIHPLQGRRKLLDTLTAVGGLLPNASRRVRVTRRLEIGRIPLPTAVEDPRAQVSTVEINLNRLMEEVNPAEDFEIEPFDIITAQPAGAILVNGEVNSPGAFELNQRDSISVIQLISMAGGLGREAAPEKARILRPVLDTTRRAEIPVNLRRILEGKDNDVPLLANDLLFVPRNTSPWASFGRITWIVIPALITTTLFAVFQR